MKRKIFLVLIVLMGLFLVNFSFFGATGFDDFLTSKEVENIENKADENMLTPEINYEVIDGTYQSNRYVVVTGKNTGYLIYDRMLQTVVEANENELSPYDSSNREGRKIYVAPTYWLYEDSQGIYSIFQNQYIDKNTFTAMKSTEKKVTTNYAVTARENMATASRATMQTTSSSSSTVSVEEVGYFDKLNNVGNSTLGDGTGSCGFVAMCMMLAYYDTFLNDDIIPEQYDIMVPVYSDTYDITTALDSPGLIDAYQIDMMDYCLENEYTDSSGVTLEEAMDCMHYYLLHCGFNNTVTELTSGLTIRAAIASHKPVFVGIYGTDTSIFSSYIAHAVVAHRYDANYIYAHYGYGGSYTSTKINGYTIDGGFIVDFPNLSHKHSDNYYRGITFFCQNRVCALDGTVKISHEKHTYTDYNSTHHIVGCTGCDFYKLQPHIWVSTGSGELYGVGDNIINGPVLDFEICTCGRVRNDVIL